MRVWSPPMRWTSIIALALLSVAPAAAEEIYLPPIAFSPTNNGSDYNIDQGGLGCLRVQKGSGFFLAVVPAARGVAIDEVAALVEDLNADALGMVSLVRRRQTSFEMVAMSPPSKGGGPVEELTARPDAPAPPQEGAVYLVQVTLTGPDVCLHGVRVRLRAL
jgi:hypothetical protein